MPEPDATPEYLIQDAIIRDCGSDTGCVLGYPGAQTIRSVRFGELPGTVDLVIPPQPETRGKLILVEAVRHDSPDANDRVIGELLKYYALARALTEAQVRQLSVYARSSPARELEYYGVGFRLPYAASQAWQPRGQAPVGALSVEQVELIVALDGRPSDTLKAIVARLREHGVAIRLVAVIDSRIHLEENW